MVPSAANGVLTAGKLTGTPLSVVAEHPMSVYLSMYRYSDDHVLAISHDSLPICRSWLQTQLAATHLSMVETRRQASPIDSRSRGHQIGRGQGKGPGFVGKKRGHERDNLDGTVSPHRAAFQIRMPASHWPWGRVLPKKAASSQGPSPPQDPLRSERPAPAPTIASVGKWGLQRGCTCQ
ncbi:hypothetical protein LZ30DRAFT_376077 [Colletotrichum cereale]|nr:hypothetical protein LZ30DRAFT_376077 [Colletotrichum cereale]